MTMRNYGTDEYRAAYKAKGGDPGPYALEGNPDPDKRNYRTSRRKPILMGVMHITAGMSDYTLPDMSAEGTTRYGADTERDASWHVCIDSDGIIPSVRDAYTAWHAGVADIANVNDASLGMEIGTGATDWRKKPDSWVQRTIRNAAVWWAPRVVKYGIPIRVENSRTAIESAIIAGRKIGFTSHKIIAPSNRTDPGWVDGVDTFPWALFFTYLREEIARFNGTTEEDIMASIDDLRRVIREEVGNVVWNDELPSHDTDPTDNVTPDPALARSNLVMANWRASQLQIAVAGIVQRLAAIESKVGVDVDEAALSAQLAAALAPTIRQAVIDSGQPAAVADAVVAKLAETLAS